MDDERIYRIVRSINPRKGEMEERKKAIIKGIEHGKMLEPYFGPGFSGGFLFDKSISKEDVERGFMLAAPGTAQQYIGLDAVIYVLAPGECPEPVRVEKGDKFQFWFRTHDVGGIIAADTAIEPGGYGNIHVFLLQMQVLDLHQRFAVRQAGRTVAAGCITKLYR